MKKILYGILAIFMSFAIAYGATFIIDNSLSTSTEISQDETTDRGNAHNQRTWWDVVYENGKISDNTFDFFSRYGGVVEEENGHPVKATIVENLKENASNDKKRWDNDKLAAYCLAGFMACVNMGWEAWRNIELVLERDVDLSDYWWVPIGVNAKRRDNRDTLPIHQFQGKFNGNGHKITGVYIRSEGSKIENSVLASYYDPGNYELGKIGWALGDRLYKRGDAQNYAIGFFGFTYNAVIENFSISGKISHQTNTYNYNSGYVYNLGVVGYAYGTTIISSVVNDGFEISYTRTTGENRCRSVGIEVNIGGIVGSLLDNSAISNCEDYSNIGVNTYSLYGVYQGETLTVGGIVGNFCSALVTRSRFTGSIVVQNFSPNDDKDNFANLFLGGIVGRAECLFGEDKESKNIIDCVNSGKIQLEGRLWMYRESGISAFGGIVGGSMYPFNYSANGNASLKLERCVNYGNITIKMMHRTIIGGLVGYADKYLEIYGCANLGDISATCDSHNNNDFGVGGILGFGRDSNQGTKVLKNCINYGNVTVDTLNGKQHKGTGGIVGRIKNRGFLNMCANYGSVWGNVNVAGIAGELGHDETNNNNKDMKTFLVSNCVNFCTQISGKEIVGQIVGYVPMESYAVGGALWWTEYEQRPYEFIKSCICNSTNNTIKAVGNTNKIVQIKRDSNQLYFCSLKDTVTSWYTGEMNGFRTSAFDNFSSAIQNSFYRADNTGGFFYSNLVAYYYGGATAGEKWWLGSATLVPMGIVDVANVNVYYRTRGNKYTLLYNNVKDNEIAKPEAYVLKKENKKFTSNKWSYTYAFEYLRGARYDVTKNLTNVLRVSANSNFNCEKLTKTDVFAEKETNYSVKTLSSTSSQKNYGANLDMFACKRLDEYNARNYNIKLDFYLAAREGEKFTDIHAVAGEYNENKSDYRGNSGFQYKSEIYGTGTDVSPFKPVYQDTISIKVTPSPGFYCDMLHAGKSTTGQKERVLEKENKMLGVQTFNFEYKYQDVLYVHFERIDYNITFNFYDSEQSVGSVTKNSVKDINTKTTSNFNIGYSEKDSSGKATTFSTKGIVDGSNDSLKNFFAYGYTYEFKVKGKNSNFKSGQLGSDKDFTLSVADFVGGERNQFSDISSKNITIEIYRTPIVYTLNLTTLYQNQAGQYESGNLGGKVVLQVGSDKNASSINFTVKDEISILHEIEKGYSLKQSYPIFNVGETELSLSAKRTSKYLNNETYFYSGQNLVDSIYEKGGISNNQIEVTSCFDLKSYNFYLSTQGVSLEKAGFEVLVDNKKFEMSTASDMFENLSQPYQRQIKFYSSVKISANEEVEGYKFVGLYLYDGSKDGKLLTLENEYNFVADPNNAKDLQSLCIYAKYLPYSKPRNSSREFTSYYETAFSDSSAKNIYKISTPDDLLLLSYRVARGENFKNFMFVQTQNIDMSGYDFNPIGTSEIPFMGTFDGGNYVISNLKFVGGDKLSNVGLFAFTENATIKNLTVDKGSWSAYSDSGLIVANAKNTTIENVHNNNCDFQYSQAKFYDIYGKAISLNELEGGVHSYNNEYTELRGVTTVENVFALRQNIGALVGTAQNCTIVGCSARADSNWSIYNLSTLIGKASNGTLIEECFNVQSVKKSNGLGVRIVGDLDGISEPITYTVKNCYCRVGQGNIDIFKASINSGEMLTGLNLNDSTFSDLDLSIWCKVNGRWTLRRFYWN